MGSSGGGKALAIPKALAVVTRASMQKYGYVSRGDARVKTVITCRLPVSVEFV